MKLGINLAYDTAVETARAAERLGYDLALAPEGYRSDAATVLGLVAGHTSRITLASGVFQIPARTAGMTALTAVTLDGLSGGRFRLGLGVSNADVSEGWYGVPFDHPLARTREYVDVIRMALRQEPVRYQGEHIRLPLPGGSGERLTLVTSPVRGQVEIYLAAVGPRNVRLAGEIADGWLAVFCSPDRIAAGLAHIRAGRAAAGRRVAGFEVICAAPTVFGDDPRVCAEPVRSHFAHFLAMGAPERNVYVALARAMGYGPQALAVGQLAKAGDWRAAAAGVPFEFVDEVALLGPVERVAERMRAYADAGVTTLAISPVTAAVERLSALRAAAKAFDQSGRG